jgi:chromosome segregation ATPase
LATFFLQKTEIFESTKEFLRQSQDSEALKGAQRVLEDQLTKANEALDHAKECIYVERGKNREVSSALEVCQKEVLDIKAVLNVLTVQKTEVEEELGKMKGELEGRQSALDEKAKEVMELKRQVGKGERAVGKLEGKLKEAEKDVEEMKELLGETKSEKERLEKEVEGLNVEIVSLKSELEEVDKMRCSFSEMEFVVKENECKIEEKVQELEATKMVIILSLFSY